MSVVEDFWNEIGAAQIVAGGAPSVRTKEIKDYEDGERELKDVLPDGVTMEDTLLTVAKVKAEQAKYLKD